MSFSLSPEREQNLSEILARYPTKAAACIPVLHLAQEQHGWISEEVVAWVADRLELSAAHVLGVASFYHLLHTEPVGEHHVWVCRTLSCALSGADGVLRRCQQRLGIRPGETTADGKVTLHTTECLASCGTGPVMQVDQEYHENLTTEAVDDILDRLTGATD